MIFQSWIRVFAASVLSAVSGVSPSLAGWKATDWGMTPAEVEAAMPNARSTDRGDKLDVGKALAVSDDVSYGLELEAVYFYGDRGLELVELEIPPKHCKAVVKSFLDERGLPLINSDQKIIRLFIWHDEPTGTRIRFVLATGICSLNFERLATYRAHDLETAANEAAQPAKAR